MSCSHSACAREPRSARVEELAALLEKLFGRGEPHGAPRAQQPQASRYMRFFISCTMLITSRRCPPRLCRTPRVHTQSPATRARVEAAPAGPLRAAEAPAWSSPHQAAPSAFKPASAHSEDEVAAVSALQTAWRERAAPREPASELAADADVRVRVFATDAAVGLLRRSDTRVYADGAGAASGGPRTMQTTSADGGRKQRARTVCMRAQKRARRQRLRVCGYEG
jgi:hypothetical protein